MDQPKQPQGNFVMNINFRHKTNKDAPAINGRISTPEDKETEFDFAAFEKFDEEGNRYWIGPVEKNRSMRQALNSQPARDEHFITIRENGFKVFKELHDGAPNPTYAALPKDQQAHEDSKPAYWGSWTRTANEPELKHAAWERAPSRYGQCWASGNTQHPLTKEQAAALAHGQPDAAVLNAPEPAQAPRGARAKAAAGNRDR